MIARKILCLFALLCLGTGGASARDLSQTNGQRLYLPIYSHVTYGDSDASGKGAISLLSAMVSIRNTDGRTPLRILSARYYDTEGRFLRNYIAKPVVVNPFGTYEIFVDSSDKSGGSGANFVIEWASDVPVTMPLIEAVHISQIAGRSLTIKTEAVEIRQDGK